MEGSSWIFFILFAATLVITYMAIRRQWAGPVTVSLTSVLVSIITMTLTSLAQGNSIIQAVVVGIVVGFVFSGATLAIAWYFHSNELRAQYMQHHAYQQEGDEANEPHPPGDHETGVMVN